MSTKWRERSAEFLVATVIFVVPIVFYRGVSEAFDLTKATVLWLLSIPLTVLLVASLAENFRSTQKRAEIAVVGFVAGSLLATFTSPYIQTSLYGQSQRYTGLVTLMSCASLSIVLLRNEKVRSFERWVSCLGASTILVMIYGCIQEFGLDIFEWNTGSFSAAFATVGNPNTASAFLSVSTSVLFGLFLHASGRSIAHWIYLLSLGLVGPLISAFTSFQGSIGVLGVVFVLCYWLWFESVTKAKALAACLIAATIVGTAQMSPSRSLFLVSLALCASAGIIARFDTEVFSLRRTIQESARWKKVVSICTIAAIVAVAGFFARGHLGNGLRGGFLERGDFFRAARDIFRSHPVFGSGLDTFGLFYTEFRPAGHALRFEELRTSSAHNIFLGMFSNGGLVLGLSYAILMIVGASIGLRAVRRIDSRRPLFIGVLGAFLSFQIVSFVSVEHVALHVLNFTLLGLLLNGSVVLASPTPKKKAGDRKASARGMRRSRQRRLPSSAVAVCLVMAIVVGSWFVTRPFRAALASFDGEVFASLERYSEAQSKFEEAARIYPPAIQNWLVLAQVNFANQDLPGAQEAASRALVNSRYSGAISGLMVSIIFRSGDIDGAIASSKRAMDLDPYAPTLKRQYAEVLYLAADVRAESEPALAKLHLEELVDRFPDYEADGLDQLLVALGVT